MMQDNISILEYLGEPEVLAQLAEEAAELAQAALKFRRALEGQNPTPKTIDQCAACLEEEIADVRLCLLILGYEAFPHATAQEDIMYQKCKRWQRRLSKVRSERSGENG